MRKQWILLAILTVGLVLGSADARIRRNRTRDQASQPPSATECMTQAGVTEEQLAAMEAIRRAAIAALKEAGTPQEAREIIEQLREDLQSVLTQEQLAAMANCMRPKEPLNCMDQLDLTAVQIEAIAAIREAAIAAIKEAESPQKARDIIERMHQAIEGVLTPEQLALLRQCLRPDKPVNCMNQIGLTAEQIAAIDALRDVAMEELKEAETREEVRAIMDRLYDDIMSMLTNEQLEALQACRDAQRPGPGPGPGPRG
jgi:uncharacterized protein YpuA (DUF1002 family)